MRRAVRLAIPVLLVAFLVIQFRQVDHTNPPVDPSKTIDKYVAVPPDIRAMFDRGCRDCHSNETHWPAYSYVAPISWDLVNHVEEGRLDMNWSAWGTYDEDTVDDILTEICEQVRSGAMPLPQYVWLHRSAKLAPQEVERWCGWAEDVRKSLKRTGPG